MFAVPGQPSSRGSSSDPPGACDRRSAPVGPDFLRDQNLAQFFRFWTCNSHPRGGRRRRLHGTHPDPITGHPAGAPRPRSLRHRPDRDRQDSRFRIADSPAPLRRTGTENGRQLPSARAQAQLASWPAKSPRASAPMGASCRSPLRSCSAASRLGPSSGGSRRVSTSWSRHPGACSTSSTANLSPCRGSRSWF